VVLRKQQEIAFSMYYCSIRFFYCCCENLWQKSYFHVLDFFFCGFVKNNTNFIFLPCKDFNFYGFIKTTKLVIFSIFTVQFDFCISVKIYNIGVFLMYSTSFLVVFWKNKTNFIFPCSRFKFLWFWEIIKRFLFSMQKTSNYLVLLKQ